MSKEGLPCGPGASGGFNIFQDTNGLKLLYFSLFMATTTILNYDAGCCKKWLNWAIEKKCVIGYNKSQGPNDQNPEKNNNDMSMIPDKTTKGL